MGDRRRREGWTWLDIIALLFYLVVTAYALYALQTAIPSQQIGQPSVGPLMDWGAYILILGFPGPIALIGLVRRNWLAILIAALLVIFFLPTAVAVAQSNRVYAMLPNGEKLAPFERHLITNYTHVDIYFHMEPREDIGYHNGTTPGVDHGWWPASSFSNPEDVKVAVINLHERGEKELRIRLFDKAIEFVVNIKVEPLNSTASYFTYKISVGPYKENEGLIERIQRVLGDLILNNFFIALGTLALLILSLIYIQFKPVRER